MTVNKTAAAEGERKTRSCEGGMKSLHKKQLEKQRAVELKWKRRAKQLPVDLLQMHKAPNHLTRCSCLHLKQLHMYVHKHANQVAERETFSAQNGEKKRKREGTVRQKGDYNLIRGRKSWSNPPKGVEMPPSWRLLLYSLTELHLNGLLCRQADRRPKRREKFYCLESHCNRRIELQLVNTYGSTSFIISAECTVMNFVVCINDSWFI